MVGGEYWRPLSDQEKVDGSIDIGFRNRTERRAFLKQAETVQKEHAQKGKPFDFRAAKLDFEAKQKAAFPFQKSKVDSEDNVKIEFDLKPYGDIKRFKQVGQRRVKEDIKRSDGLKETIYHTYNEYVSTVSGAKYSILEPIAPLEKKEDKTGK